MRTFLKEAEHEWPPIRSVQQSGKACTTMIFMKYFQLKVVEYCIFLKWCRYGIKWL